jgi:carbon monoxide dehydrogenase subunit G
MMEMSGNQLMKAPRSAVWEALVDPQTLMRCVRGCEDATRVSDVETHVRILVKLGPVRARFAGKMFMSEIVPTQRCKLSFEGVGGGAGSAKGFSNVELEDESDGTRLTYSVSATVGGKLGQIGGRLIDSSAKKMADDFFRALQLQLQGISQADHFNTPDALDPAVADSPISSNAKGTRQPGVTASPPMSPWSHTSLWPELYRVGWFALGVITTVLLRHWS